MKKLYVPWRKSYAQTVNAGKGSDTPTDECVFCIQLGQNNDEQNLILKRCTYNAVLMNKYPYNAGHLLIIPYKHINSLDQQTTDARYEQIELVTHTATIVKDVLGAHGVNVGINLGEAAGAGIPSHLHTHVLPRWERDTNFLPALADTKTISFDLHDIYKKLKPHCEQLNL